MIGLIAEIAFYLVLPIITWIISHYMGYNLTASSAHNIIAMLLMIIVSPIVEEIIFRGMLQEWLFKFKQNTLLTILILNLGFAFAHYKINSNLIYLVAVFICGLIFSRLKIRFGNLKHSIVMHIYYNAVFWVANA